MAADQHQLVVVGGPATQVGLPQALTLGAHQEHPPPVFDRNRLKGGIDRLRFEHHAGATAIGFIVHFAIAILGKIAGILTVQFGNAGLEGPANDPQTLERRERFRRQADDIKAHRTVSTCRG